MPSEAELLARPGVVQAQLTAQVGRPMPDVSISSNLNAAKVVVTASTESEVERHMRELVPWFVSAVTVE